MKLLPERTQCLVAYPSTLRSLANTIRGNGFNYSIERCTWKNFNRGWKGYRGLLLRVSHTAYLSLFKPTQP